MRDKPAVAVVDYGLGNVFSVLRACEHVGLNAKLTSDRKDIAAAPAVILPGVGAFGDAMATLQRLDLVSVLRDAAAANKPLMGICLGLQLLMTESAEFGHHQGLNLIEGDVVRLPDAMKENGQRLKVPEVCWNQVRAARPWKGTPLQDLAEGAYQYFVHSYYVRPTDANVVLSKTTYGQTEFCSSVEKGTLFACQFHPERSGPAGLTIYSNF